MSIHRGVWTNGKRQLTGVWEYRWASDRFLVRLDSRDRIVGSPREMILAGEHPEWGNWKLLREPNK